MKRIYFDNNATTPLAPEVFELMRPYLLEDYGNASSIHWFGQRAKAGVEKAREQVARFWARVERDRLYQWRDGV